MTPDLRTRALGPVLVFTTTVAAVISSLGAPLIPDIATVLEVPFSTAQWSLTAALLAGACSAPVLGRLGDGRRRRGTLIGGLAAVTLGGVLAAKASSLGVLLAGRGLQGVGLALVPLTMAAARDHLPADRVPGMISLLAVSGAAGAGAGYPVSGLIADRAGLSAAFAFGAVFSGIALVSVAVVLPRSTARHPVPLDVPGSVILSVGLLALLLAVGQGNSWGWLSPPVLTLLATAGVLLAGWVLQQLRAAAPLVELRLLRDTRVLVGDVCAMIFGVAMYMYISTVTAFVQTPRAAGYGFSGSVVLGGLCILPFSVLSLVASASLPRLTRYVGARAVLPVASLAVAGAGAFFALFHTFLWQAFVMMAVLGFGVGLAFATIPGLIVSAVPDRETGSAMGFYQVARYIGFSLGSAVTGAVLASYTRPGQQLPLEAGYTTVLVAAAVLCAAAAVLTWVLPGRRIQQAPEGALAVEDATLGSAGLVGPAAEQPVPPRAGPGPQRR